MRKILIFTGAGASVPLGLPTVTEFMEEIQNNPLPITNEILNYLSSYKDDIEKILSTLEEFQKSSTLTEFLLDGIVSENSFTITSHPGALYPGKNTNIQSVINESLKVRKVHAKREITRIKKIVFKKLQKYKQELAINLYSSIFKEIKEALPESSISLITTNYDLTLETAIENYGDTNWESLGISDFDFGFITKYGRPIYSKKSDFEWQKDKIEYLKVHGSLDWHRDSSEQCTRSMSSTTPEDPDQMVILYPGFKGVPSKEPFISLHNKLSSRLQQADLVYVIGFAFRDQYINNIFESTLRTRADLKIIYMNPASIEELPSDSYASSLSQYKNFIYTKDKLEIREAPLKIAEHLKL